MVSPCCRMVTVSPFAALCHSPLRPPPSAAETANAAARQIMRSRMQTSAVQFIRAAPGGHYCGFRSPSRQTAGYHQARAVQITISKENYLKAIAEAESEGEVVKAVTLTRWLHVSAPAVTMAIKRLKRDGLIRADEDGQLTLTPAGREIANRVLNRHHLIERMLSEIFGLEWYKVHDEAEHLEHAVSTDFERKLTEKLGRGGACPHGNIVGMDSPEARRARGLKPLDEARPDEHLQVVSVFERDRALLERLDGLGIRPGATVQVESAGENVELRAGPRSVAVDRAAAARVWVKSEPRR